MALNEKMRFKVYLFLQSAFILFVIVSTLCVTLTKFASPHEDSASAADSSLVADRRIWQERAPRSVKEDYNNREDVDSPDFPIVRDSLEVDVVEPQLSEKSKKPATAKSATVLDDIFISVKTTKKFHKSRLELILKTWFNLAKEQIWFFSDYMDEEFKRKTNNHLIDTKCPPTHNRKALCCKMSREFDAFLESEKKWWCHFDDDNYVNVPALVKSLGSYDPQQDWYLGRPSINIPLEILNKKDLSKISFWFATGGAGFCLSRSLALKMMPLAGGGKFISVGEKIRLPDDVTMGYIIEHLLRKKLTVVDGFHSHLEPLRFLEPESFESQISFGYSPYGSEMNVIQIDGLPDRVDPTRMYSLHCKLFPSALYCPR